MITRSTITIHRDPSNLPRPLCNVADSGKIVLGTVQTVDSILLLLAAVQCGANDIVCSDAGARSRLQIVARCVGRCCALGTRHLLSITHYFFLAHAPNLEPSLLLISHCLSLTLVLDKVVFKSPPFEAVTS